MASWVAVCKPSIESEEVRRKVRLAGAILVPIWSHLASLLGLLRSSRQNRRLRKQLFFYDFSVERRRDKGEGSLHTGEVQGSIPCASTTFLICRLPNSHSIILRESDCRIRADDPSEACRSLHQPDRRRHRPVCAHWRGQMAAAKPSLRTPES